jgi:hypothetical protein
MSLLAEDLTAAEGQVEVGGLYAHYKNPDKPYEVTGLVILEATDEVAVLYTPQYEDISVTFARALSSWLEDVEWEGKVVPRFVRIDK